MKHYDRDYLNITTSLAYKHFLSKQILNCLIFIIITLFCEKYWMESDYLVNILKIYYSN